MNKYTIVAVMLACLAFGYYLRGLTVEPTEIKSMVGHELDRVRPDETDPEVADRGPPLEETVLSQELEALLARIGDASIDGYLERARGNALMEYLLDHAEVDSRNLIKASEIFDQLSENGRARYLGPLMEAWNQQDPASAYRWLQASALNGYIYEDDFNAFQEGILTTLAARDPMAASVFIRQVSHDSAREGLVIALAQGWAGKDVAQAFQFLNTIADYNVSNWAIEESYIAIMTQNAALDPAGTAKILEQLEAGRVQSRLLGPVVSQLAEEDLHSTLEWVLGLKVEASRDTGIERLVDEYSEDQPEHVLETILKYQSELSDGMLEGAIVALSEGDPHAVARSFHEAPQSIQREVAGPMVSKFVHEDPQAAIEWMSTQSDPLVLDASARSVSEFYSYRDPAAAVMWGARVKDDAKRYAVLSSLITYSDFDSLGTVERGLQSVELGGAERERLLHELDQRLNYANAPLIVP